MANLAYLFPNPLPGIVIERWASAETGWPEYKVVLLDDGNDRETLFVADDHFLATAEARSIAERMGLSVTDLSADTF